MRIVSRYITRSLVHSLNALNSHTHHIFITKNSIFISHTYKTFILTTSLKENLNHNPDYDPKTKTIIIDEHRSSTHLAEANAMRFPRHNWIMPSSLNMRAPNRYKYVSCGWRIVICVTKFNMSVAILTYRTHNIIPSVGGQLPKAGGNRSTSALRFRLKVVCVWDFEWFLGFFVFG